MKEIEIKVIGYPEEDLLQQIERLNGQFDCVEKQINYHIDSDLLPFDPDQYLRIRSVYIDDRLVRNEFTFKQRVKLDHARVNEEETVEIDDIESLLFILSKIGYDRVQKSTKIRRRYLLPGARIELDEWDKDFLSYPYFEIEAESEDRLAEVIRELEIPASMISTKSIRELRLEDKKIKSGLDEQEGN